MNNFIIFSILIFAFTLVSCGSKETEPQPLATATEEIFTTHTFVVKWIGDESLKTKTMNDLTLKKCWILKDVAPLSHVSSTDCHEFVEYKNKSDVHGAYKKIGSSYLMEIKASKNDTFSVQIFAQEGKKLRRILKPGKFIDPDDFAETLRRMTFK
jgi:hypothetical protein